MNPRTTVCDRRWVQRRGEKQSFFCSEVLFFPVPGRCGHLSILLSLTLRAPVHPARASAKAAAHCSAVAEERAHGTAQSPSGLMQGQFPSRQTARNAVQDAPMFLTPCIHWTFQRNFQISAESTLRHFAPLFTLVDCVLNNKLWPPASFLRMFMMRTHSSKSAGQWNKINQEFPKYNNICVQEIIDDRSCTN